MPPRLRSAEQCEEKGGKLPGEAMEKSSGAMEEPSNPSPSFPVVRMGERALSPGSGVVTFFCEPPCEESSPHFLDACHLCRRPLGHARDIFMYRGDTPFCSEECRQEQIELDEGRKEEKAGYRRSTRKRQYPSSHRVREPTEEAAEVQGIHNPATSETAVAS